VRHVARHVDAHQRTLTTIHCDTRDGHVLSERPPGDRQRAGPPRWRTSNGPVTRCRVASYGFPRLHIAVEGTLPDGLVRVGAQLVDGDRADVDVRLHTVERSRWVLSDEVFGLAAGGLRELARSGADSIVAVVAHCVCWHSPLRLAKRCTDLPGALSVRLLDETAPSSNPQDPHGPELGRAGWPRYVVKFRQRFCIEVRNHSRVDLQVVLFKNNVASGGQVQILADSTTSSAGGHTRFG
jgi:hypothetical protein